MALNRVSQDFQPIIAGGAGAAQSNVATLTAVANKMTYIEGFDITGGGATAASIIEISVAGLAGGTIKFEMNVAAGATAAVNGQGGLFIRFPSPLPASALNTAITVTAPSYGSGNTNAAVTAYGFHAS